MVKVNVTLRQ